MNDEMRRAAAARATGMQARADRPRERRSAECGTSRVRVSLTLRAAALTRSGGAEGATLVGGYASVTETPYEMYDFWGPYTEVVSRGAFGKTLGTSPLVEFTVNHARGGSLPMAHTRNGTLALSEDETGLAFEASVDPARSDVADMLRAMERGDLAEASFKFSIDSGMWSPDYDEFRIDVVDLERGDVSAVNFGANPHASSGLRSTHLSPEPDVAPVAQLRDHAPLVRTIRDY